MKKIVLLSILSLTLFTGCHPYGGGIIIDDGYSHNPYSPPVYAPAHGRRLHQYYYYPNAEIYFDVGRNTYFYLNSAGAWTFSINLPIHLRSHLRNGYVEVEMEYDRPYLRHKYYRNKYQKNKIYKPKLNNGRRYDNDRNYRNDGILRQDPKRQDPNRQNSKSQDPRSQNRGLENRQDNNERKYDERQYKNEQRYKYKENKELKKQEKYEKDDGNNKQEKNIRRNDLY